MKKKIFLFILLPFLIFGIVYAASTITKGLIGKQDISLWDGSSTKTFTRTTSDGYTLTLNQIDWPGVDVKQVYGGGVNSTNTEISSALTAIGTSTDTAIWLAPGTWTISADLSLATYSNIYIVMAPGALFSVSSGKTLTMYSPDNIIASPYQQIFSGAGTIASTVAGWSSAEWFGIDGTNDHTEINAALTAFKKVKLLATTYNAAQITMVADGVLEGQGFETIISTTGLSDSSGEIYINGVSGWRLANLKIDGQSDNATDGTFDNCLGIEITGNVVNGEIENVWVYDAHRMAMEIHPGAGTIEDINITEFKGEYGADSGLILIGTRTDEAGKARNINFNGIHLIDAKLSGFGVWRQNGTGTVENINVNNIIMENWNTAGGSNPGFWTHDAQDVTLNNFVFDTMTAGAGHALYFEHGKNHQASNGVIKNVDGTAGGIWVAPGGVAASEYAEDLSFSNILIHSGYKGVGIFEGALNVSLENITVRDCSNFAYQIGGVNTKLSNCSSIDNYAASDAFSIVGTAAESVTNMQIVNCTEDGSTNSVRLSNYVASVFFRNNNFADAIAYSNSMGPYGHGDTLVVRIRESVAAGTDYTVPVFMLPDGYNGALVTNAYLMFSADITQNDTNYNTYTLQRRDSAGDNPASMVAINTKSTGGLDFNDNDAVNLTELANNQLSSSNPNISIAKTHAASGQAEADGILILDIILH